MAMTAFAAIKTMKTYPLQQLASAMSGTLLQTSSSEQGGGEIVISAGVSTDTRKIAEGSLFIALKGENFDAHDFLDQASAAAALVIEDQKNLPEGVPAILVNDTLKALQDLAAWYLRELNIPVVAITGSNGKTSTKDFTRSVLAQKFRVNATLGNFNNHIGLPLTVLATKEDDELAILEMGMNHSGELAPLCEIAKPNLSIITNVGTAHIENMGSREAIALEKGTVARSLEEKGTLLVPADCDFIDDYRDSTKARVIATGEDDIRAENIVPGPAGSEFDLVIDALGTIRTSIAVAGQHMISNALLAAGAGHILGLSLQEIADGLSNATLTSGRLRQYDSFGITVIDDTYNANPESIIAALNTLANLPCSGKRTAVLGKMAELGDHAAEAYPRIGKVANDLQLTLVTVGDEAAAYGAPHHFDDIQSAATHLLSNQDEGDLVLFKGSRAAAMEKVMELAFPADD